MLTASVSINVGNLALDDSSIQETPICNTQSLLRLILLSFAWKSWGLDSFECSRRYTVVVDSMEK